ncbi:hypothetical protein DFA_02123 [Cavenderia fasciculata]|uniref:Uncharacterized protein n=1 Tax=Cavenderia fasciculata TaxID=261658 RepID=F4PYS0_CACFS|nr:uncharacterized protein DFA_02123 [Cavenderia fasciculata]EGG19336.1 hypothetical protein DFA_02123 [Cavenderia fasciculata]|eukprot:XP_004357607.1 hypothetical protein DFA_02123 [Cavenderia fasciculata]
MSSSSCIGLFKSLTKQSVMIATATTVNNAAAYRTCNKCKNIYTTTTKSSSSSSSSSHLYVSSSSSSQLQQYKRFTYCTINSQQQTTSKTSIPLDIEDVQKKDNLCTLPSQQQQNIENNVNNKSSSTSSSTSSSSSSSSLNVDKSTSKSTTEVAPTCWCLINCKLKDKCINVSMVKPIVYEAEKGYILGEYKVNYEMSRSDMSKSRKKFVDACVRENNIFIDREKRRLAESEDRDDDEDDDDEDDDNNKTKEEEVKILKEQTTTTTKQEEKKERKETKKLFKTEEEKEALERKYPILNDELTSIGPIHVIYKNEWITTVVEKIEIENKDIEPYFVLKLMTPIRRSNRLTFEIESLSYFSTIEKLLSFNKSVECSDKEFEKMFLTKSSDKITKTDTKWMMEKRPYLREALMTLKTTLLPSLGFGNSGITLTLSKEEVVKCREGNTQLEFPIDTYQLCLEVDSQSSIWNKEPQSIEKILYLYTVILDSLVSIDGTVDIPIDQTYL